MTVLIVISNALLYQQSSSELEEILNHYYNSIGIQNRLNINTLRILGNEKYYNTDSGYHQKKFMFRSEFERQIMKNKGFHIKIKHLKSSIVSGSIEYCVYGDNAWKKQGAGYQVWYFGAADSIQCFLFMDTESELYNWKRKGHDLRFIGDRSIDKKSYKCLRLKLKEKYNLYYYIDTKSWLIHYISYYEEYRDDFKVPVYIFSKYKNYNGYVYPTKIISRAYFLYDVGTTERVIDKVLVNAKIDEKNFEMPINQE
jgi:hypothetical protein